MGANRLVGGIEDALRDIETDAPLEQVEALREARNLLDWHIEQAVALCRRGEPVVVIDDTPDGTRHDTRFEPVSWARIGAALGVSAQGAHKRFRSSANAR